MRALGVLGERGVHFWHRHRELLLRRGGAGDALAGEVGLELVHGGAEFLGVLLGDEDGNVKIFAARIICELTCTQCSNPWMTGRKRSWTSHTMKIAFSRARRGGDAPTAEATGIAPTRTVVGERERLMTREMRFGGDRRVEACASAIVSESRRSQFPEHTTA